MLPLSHPHSGAFPFPSPKTQFHVLLEGGTDAPDAPPTPQQHSSEKTPEVTNGASVAEDSTDSTRFWGRNEKSGKGEEKSGVFVSALGGLPLFLPEDELKSVDSTRRLGWPGFRRPAHPDHVVRAKDSRERREGWGGGEATMIREPGKFRVLCLCCAERNLCLVVVELRISFFSVYVGAFGCAFIASLRRSVLLRWNIKITSYVVLSRIGERGGGGAVIFDMNTETKQLLEIRPLAPVHVFIA